MKTALIVEDSRLARSELMNLLKKTAEFEKLYEAKDAEEAKKVLKAHPIDVLFLDIHLPGMDGFELLESLDTVPPVIFTTAFDKYAIKAFDYNTIDYLLKPIKKERLVKALEKIKKEVAQGEKSDKKANINQQVFVRDGEKCWFVKLSEISLFESVGNYSKVFFEGEKPLIQKSLNYLESVLDETHFVRVNRQQIVNLNHIEKIDNWSNGKLRIVLKTGEEIEVSRRQSQRIKHFFSL